MRLGVVFPHRHLSADPPAIRAHAQAAEAAGYNYYLAYDHVLGAQRDRPGGFQGPYDAETPFTEPFILFAHLAAITSTLEFVSGVVILPQRQTALVAKQVADLQRLSNGRFTLGVGLGWNKVEYDALGQDFHTRGRRIEEQVQLIRQLLEQPVVDFEGDFDRVELAGIEPRPAQRVPIWMGGGHPNVLERVGRLADGWIPIARSIDEMKQSVDRIHEVAREHGRDPGDIAIAPQLVLSGELRKDLDRAHRYEAAGASHMGVSTVNSDFASPADHIEAIEQFAEAWHDE